MKLFTIISILCAVYVIYNVWFVNQKISFWGKVIWSAFAVFFNVFTAIIYYFLNRK